jgi:hypothetical protein
LVRSEPKVEATESGLGFSWPKRNGIPTKRETIPKIFLVTQEGILGGLPFQRKYIGQGVIRNKESPPLSKGVPYLVLPRGGCTNRFFENFLEILERRRKEAVKRADQLVEDQRVFQKDSEAIKLAVEVRYCAIS